MATNVTFNGVTYSVPAANEENWSSLSSYLIALQNASVAGGSQSLNVRVVATATVSVATSDSIILVNRAGAVAVNLPAGVDKQVFWIADISGAAETNNITINRNGTNTIFGGTSYVLNQNNQAVCFVFSIANGNWNRVAETKLPANGAANTVLASDGTKLAYRTIVNADISASAAIDRSKLASGTANHVLINNASGVLTSEAQLAISRGGTGLAALGSAFQVLRVDAGGTALEYASVSGLGDVAGPSGGVVNNEIVLFASTTGKAVKGIGAVGATGQFLGTPVGTTPAWTNQASSISLTNSTNQMVFGSGINKITINVPTPSANLVYSVPNNVGSTATFAMLEANNQTFSGSNTSFSITTSFTATTSINLGTAPNRVALLPGTQTVTANWLFPNLGDCTFAALEGAQTFSGLKTFSSGLAVTGGSAANGAIWFASNVLRQRGGASGWAVDNTSAAAILSLTDAGAATVGAASATNAAGVAHLVNGVLNANSSTTTDFARRLILNSNTYIAGETGRVARDSLSSTMGGAAFSLMGRTADTSTAFLWQTNLIADSATTAATTVMTITQLGAVNIGPTGSTSTSLAHVINLPNANSYVNITSTGVNSARISASTNTNAIISGRSTTNNVAGLAFVAGTADTNSLADMYFQVLENDNTDFATQTNTAFAWYNGAGTAIISVTRAGAVTLGPASFTGKHIANARNLLLRESTGSTVGAGLGNSQITLANGATYTSADFFGRGLIIISDTSTANQSLILMGNTTATIISDPPGVAAVTDTGSRVCVFYNGTAWTIKNNLGSTKTFAVTVLSSMAAGI